MPSLPNCHVKAFRWWSKEEGVLNCSTASRVQSAHAPSGKSTHATYQSGIWLDKAMTQSCQETDLAHASVTSATLHGKADFMFAQTNMCKNLKSRGEWFLVVPHFVAWDIGKTLTSCLATGTLYTCPLSFLKPRHPKFACPNWEENTRNLSKCNLIGQGKGSEFPRNRFGTRINHISNPSREGWSHVGANKHLR